MSHKLGAESHHNHKSEEKMAPKTSPRAQRRRSCCPCPSFLCILVIAWAVMMMGSNLARVLMLPDFEGPQGREEVQKPPNYYQLLGVDPLVDDETLSRLRRNFILEMHPVSKRSLLHLLALPSLVESTSCRSFWQFSSSLTIHSIAGQSRCQEHRSVLGPA